MVYNYLPLFIRVYLFHDQVHGNYMNRREFFEFIARTAVEARKTPEQVRLDLIESQLRIVIDAHNHNSDILQEVVDTLGLSKNTYTYDPPSGGTAELENE